MEYRVDHRRSGGLGGYCAFGQFVGDAEPIEDWKAALNQLAIRFEDRVPLK